jgi:hypothetical protein
MWRNLPWLALSLLLTGTACRRPPAPAPAPAAPPTCEQRSQSVKRSLNELEGPDGQRVVEALARARTWLDGMTVDPIELGRRGLLGKLKLAELLSAYYQLWKAASGGEREALLRRIEQIVKPVRQRKYHDMLSVDRDLFNRESTSYLWIAYLMERAGLDISDYRKSILGLQARLDARLEEGGPQVRKILQWQYAYFGLAWPSTMGEPRREFILTMRPDFRNFDRELGYRLTHEVLALYEYGDALGTDPLPDDELRYARAALYWLARENVRAGETDLAAELATCLRLVRALDLPVYPEALKHLLDTQLASGAWGRFEAVRRTQGEEMQRLARLHTTGDSVQALLLAFHPAWNANVPARCPPDRAPAVARD